MAKINLTFKGKKYSIDKSLLEGALASLEEHLVTMMDGPVEPELGFPITWNTMEVVGNATADGEIPWVKVSSYIPTVEELGREYLFSIRLGEQEAMFTIGTSDELRDDDVLYYVDINELDYKLAVVLKDGAEYEGDIVPESGLYAINYGSMGNSLDCTIDLVNSTPTEERLEGDGAEFYTLAPTALSFRSTAPLNELQEIQINGVTVDPSNYTLEEGSTIVTFPIDYLKMLNVGNYEVAVASESKTVKGDFTVAAPDLNEHGFYYNQPYTAYVDYFDANMTFFMREDGTANILTNGNVTETCTYSNTGASLTFNTQSGTFTATSSNDGTEVYCNELAANFVLGDESIAADEDYIYAYNSSLDGYVVQVIDRTQASYDPIRTNINGKPTVKLDVMFLMDNGNLTVAPIIPDSVTSICESAFMNCTNLSSVNIPSLVTDIDGDAFRGCTNLSSIEIPSSVTYISGTAFSGCPNLIHITFKGTTEQWNNIFIGGGTFYDITATEVVCSDGQVSLV